MSHVSLPVNIMMWLHRLVGAQWSHDALRCELCATIYRAEITMELSVFPGGAWGRLPVHTAPYIRLVRCKGHGEP